MKQLEVYLTFSPGPGGEHTMTVAGEGRRPTLMHAQVVADEAGIAPRRTAEIVAGVQLSIENGRLSLPKRCFPHNGRKTSSNPCLFCRKHVFA